VLEILLVEDNAADAELTLRVLHKEKLANPVVRAADGAIAMALLEERAAAGRTFGLILLDLKLPKISGLEVLRRIKADERLRTTPVVVLTSSREDPDIARCYELGVNSYVVKPVQFDRFHDTVKQLWIYWLMVNHPPRD